jgi:hypothetical protein
MCFFHIHFVCWLMSDGAIGDAWEILANVERGYPGSCACRRSRMARRNERRLVLVVLLRLGRAVLGTGGVAAVSPVVTTVVLEK